MSILDPKEDVMGRVVQDYFEGNRVASATVISAIDDNYELTGKDLFRSWEMFSDIEKMAIEECNGLVLDIGAGAGSHALELMMNDEEVDAIEISPLACETMRKRGLEQVFNENIFSFFPEEKYDTLLMMMNGIGLCQSIDGVYDFLDHAKEFLLNENGQIIYDSCFVKEERKTWSLKNKTSYGRVDYKMFYRDYETATFYWLYIDFEDMKKIAIESGFSAELLKEGEDGSYLARLCLLD